MAKVYSVISFLSLSVFLLGTVSAACSTSWCNSNNFPATTTRLCLSGTHLQEFTNFRCVTNLCGATSSNPKCIGNRIVGKWKNCDVDDGWEGGGDTAGCGNDPSSQYMEYKCTGNLFDENSRQCWRIDGTDAIEVYQSDVGYTQASCKATPTQTKDCDSQDMCSRTCNRSDVRSYKDYYVVLNTNTCTSTWGSLIDTCNTKPSWDYEYNSQGPTCNNVKGASTFLKGGYARDYTSCSGGTCAYTDYYDTCNSNTILNEMCIWGEGGAGHSEITKNCEDFESTYCSDNDVYRREWGCGGTPPEGIPQYCSDDFATDTLVEDCDLKDKWYGGGDVGPGCNEFNDPASQYRDYSCAQSDPGVAQCGYTPTQTKECDSQDGWYGGGNTQKASCGQVDDDATLQEKDYFTILNTGTCTSTMTNCGSKDCDSQDAWYGGGDTPGCGSDPDSYWRDYYVQKETENCNYTIDCTGTNPVNCDSLDVCSNVCDGTVVKQYKDHYVIRGSGSCKDSFGATVEDCSAKPSEDSDQGKNYSVKGSVIDYTNCSSGSCLYTTYTDYCFYTGSDEVVVEYYTVGAGYGQESHTCDYECKEGACVEQECPDIVDPPCPDGTLIPQDPDEDGCPRPPTCCGNGVCEGKEDRDNCNDDCKLHCNETDGGRNYNVKGYTHNEEDNGTDYCDSSYNLIEYYCGTEGHVLSESWFCSYGCSEGKCLEKESDIIAVNLTLPSENPNAGELVELNFTVYYSTNLEYSEYVNFDLYDNGKLFESPYGYYYRSFYLKPNDYTTLTVQWYPETKGEHELTIILDPNNWIEETNESNNNITAVVQAEEPDCPDKIKIFTYDGEIIWYHQETIDAGDSKTIVIGGDEYVIEVLGIMPDNVTAIVKVNGESEEIAEGNVETIAGLMFFVEDVTRQDLEPIGYTGNVTLKFGYSVELYEGDFLTIFIKLYDSLGNTMPNRKFYIQMLTSQYNSTMPAFTDEEGTFLFYNNTIYSVYEDMEVTLKAFSNMTDCEFVSDQMKFEFKASPLKWQDRYIRDAFQGEPFDITLLFEKNVDENVNNVTVTANCITGCVGYYYETFNLNVPELNKTLTGFMANEDGTYGRINITVSYEHVGREFSVSRTIYVDIKDPIIKERLILNDIDGFIYEYSNMWDYYSDKVIYSAAYSRDSDNYYEYYRLILEEHDTEEGAQKRFSEMVRYESGNLTEEIIEGQKVYLLKSSYQTGYFWISDNFIVDLWYYHPLAETKEKLGQISGVTVVPQEIATELAEEVPREEDEVATIESSFSLTGLITGMATASGVTEPIPIVKAYLEKYGSTIESLTEEDLLDIALKLELLKVKFMEAELICLEIADYYESLGDDASAEKFRKIADMFVDMVDDIDEIKQFISENLDDIIRMKDELKEMIAELKLSIKEVLKTLVSS